MRITMFFLWVLAFVLPAQTNKDKDHSKYFPLSVGNKWEYVKLKQGNVISTSITEVTKKKAQIFIVNSDIEMFGMTISSQSWYTVNSSKLVIVGGGGGLFVNEPKSYKNSQVELQFPLKVGSEWDYTEDGGKKVFRKVLNWHDSLQTDFGSFNDVYEIQEKIIDGTFTVYRYLYYAYGIGLVKEEIDESGTGRGVRNAGNVLRTFKIK